MIPPPKNPDPQNPDVRIDHVLNALRTTAPPAGLEQRVAQRLTNAAEARTPNISPFAPTPGRGTTPFFAVILNAVKDPRIFLAPPTRYALAATSLVAMLAALSLFALHARQQSSAPSQASASILPLHPSARNPSVTASFEGAGLQSRRTTPIIHAHQPSALANTQVPQGLSLGSPSSLTNTHAPQGFSLGSHPPPNHSEASTPAADPDAIALAETLAPSRPAPPAPLTQQERLLLGATRQGQPLEMAELQPLRQSTLRSIAEAHQRASVRQYIQALLGPLAAAQAINPTSPSPLPDEAQLTAPSDPPSSK